jgi:hypothetical protein
MRSVFSIGGSTYQKKSRGGGGQGFFKKIQTYPTQEHPEITCFFHLKIQNSNHMHEFLKSRKTIYLVRIMNC